jgi:hypothetical protein
VNAKTITARSDVFTTTTFLVLALLAGAFVAIAPVIALLVCAAVGAVALLLAPLHGWLIVAFILIVTSRVVVATGWVPDIVNYLHFPLVASAFFVALISPRSATHQEGYPRLLPPIFGLLAVSIFSMALNRTGVISAVLNWMILVEPALLIVVMLRSEPTSNTLKTMLRLALIAAAIQVPFALGLATARGIGDAAQGTFIGLGQGASASAAVALMGALLLAARAAHQRRRFIPAVIGIAALLLVPLVADAKMILAAFLLGGLFILLSGGIVRPMQTASIVGVVLVLVTLASSVLPTIRNVWNPSAGALLADRKIRPVHLFSEQATDAPTWFFGFGPGATFSYLALQTSGAVSEEGSPLAQLRRAPTRLTESAMALSSDVESSSSLVFRFSLSGTSAAWQLWSTWAGVFGDLGLAGAALYLWIWLGVWRSLRRVRSWESLAARGILLAAIVLSVLYRWGEEASFMIPVAFIISFALASSYFNAEENGERGEQRLSGSVDG